MIGSTVNFAEYAGNGSTSTAYVIPFRYDAAGWVFVTVADSEGIITTLEQVTDYTLDGDGTTADGIFTTTEAIPDTATVTVYREAPGLQSLDLVANSPLPANSLEAQLDRLAMAAQDSVRERDMEQRIRDIELTPGPIGEVSTAALNIAIATRQPLDSDLTAYAADPTAAILANFPLVLLTEVPTSQVVISAGTQQKIRVTPASETVAVNGSASITVTSADMVGSPVTLSVPLVIGNTQLEIIQACKDALNGSSTVLAYFDVFSSLFTVELQVKTINGIYPANDATALIEIAAGSAGITARTSTITQAGVAGSGTPANPVPSAIGETAVVNHSDDTHTEWGAVDLVTWLPRTAGIIYNRTTSQWERTFIASGTIQTEILPDQ